MSPQHSLPSTTTSLPPSTRPSLACACSVALVLWYVHLSASYLRLAPVADPLRFRHARLTRVGKFRPVTARFAHLRSPRPFALIRTHQGHSIVSYTSQVREVRSWEEVRHVGKVAMKMESAGRYHSRAHCVTFALSRLLCFSPPRDCIAVREVGVVPWS